jgi:hypothetical protein
MGKRYTINSEFVFEDCLVTPGVYEGVLQRFDEFVSPFISHLHARSQQHKARDYMKGLLSDTERKNVESISPFCRRRTGIAVTVMIGSVCKFLSARPIGMMMPSSTSWLRGSPTKSVKKMVC